jgi:DNA/RNA-binding domain of Phe-tRNA-synthetase-like protein
MIAPISLGISEVAGNFPAFRVALVVADALVIPAARPPMLEAFVEETAARVARDLAGVELADVAELKAWRQVYRAFGVKKTSYRSSVERLLKNIQRGAGLPRVNVLVDAYNAISAFYRMPVGADDLDRVAPPLSFRYARPGDTFVGLGDPAATPDPPRVGEVVYADAEKMPMPPLELVPGRTQRHRPAHGLRRGDGTNAGRRRRRAAAGRIAPRRPDCRVLRGARSLRDCQRECAPCRCQPGFRDMIRIRIYRPPAK